MSSSSTRCGVAFGGHRLALCALVSLLAVPSTARCDEWIGRRVFWKDSAQPRVGAKKIDRAQIPYPATISQVDGEWLWLDRAWVPRSDVMNMDQALAYWTEQIRQHPESARAHEGRGIVRSERGELEDALADLTEAIRIDPRQASLWNNRGSVWDQKGEYENAIRDYSEAIRLMPSYAVAYANRGLARLLMDQRDAAVADCTEAIRLDPGSEQAYVARANGRFQSGDYERAVADIESALRLNPASPTAAAFAAWLRATCPDASFRDAAQAVELARKAGDLEGWAYPENFDVLAAANAERGDFQAAIAAQETAIALQARSPATLRDRRGFAQALERYKSGAAYRDHPGVGNP